MRRLAPQAVQTSANLTLIHARRLRYNEGALKESTLQANTFKDLRHNFAVNIADGLFFGAAMGFASQVAVIPLFIASLTDQTWIIGLISSLFTIGWQLPQLLTADHVARLRRYKRTVLFLSLQERWPHLALAVVALLSPALGANATLLLALLLLGWQALGGGITATAWQSMINKVIPAHRRGAFYGTQAGASYLVQSITVVIAGWLLLEFPSPLDFALCFACAGVSMVLSYLFLAQTREMEAEPNTTAPFQWRLFSSRVGTILRRDGNFRWFLAARMLSQFSIMATAFFAVYAVRRFGADEGIAGLMAGMLALAQMVASPLFGLAGDRWGHRRAFAAGMLSSGLSAVVALTVTDLNWLPLAFVLAGVATGAFWTTVMAIAGEFGTQEQRSYYIGLANTLIAPAALIAPVAGGWLADALGFEATFALAAACGLAGAAILQFVMRDPQPRSITQLEN